MASALKIVTDNSAPRTPPTETTHWFRLVTQKRDDFKTVILPRGAKLDRFAKNPQFLWMHKAKPKAIDPHTPEPKHILGRFIEMRISDEALDGLVLFNIKNPLAVEVLQMVKDGFCPADSIGFLPIKVEHRAPNDAREAQLWGVPLDEVTTIVAEWELYEASSVTIGSNEDALEMARSAGMNNSVHVELEGADTEDASQERGAKKPAKPKKPVKPSKKPKKPSSGHTPSSDDEDLEDDQRHDDDEDEDGEDDRSTAGYVVSHDPFSVDSSEEWDADAERHQWAKLSGGDLTGNWAGVDKAKYAKLFAFVADDGQHQSDYKLPHHSVVDGDLKINRKGVSAALAALHGARGGVHVPAEHKEAVEAHLQKEQQHIDEHDERERAAAEVATRAATQVAEAATQVAKTATETAERASAGNPTIPPVATQEIAERVEPMKMSSEHRWAARNLIGRSMNMAGEHLQAASQTKEEPLVKFHHDAAEHCMGRAAAMAGHLRDAGGMDGDEMRFAALTTERKIDEKLGTPELRARFAEVAAAVKPFDMVLIEEQVRGALKIAPGIGDTEQVAGALDGFAGMQERLAVLSAERQVAQGDALKAIRDAEIKRLLDARLMSPAIAQRAASERWSPPRLAKYEASMGGVPMAEVARIAPLNPVAPTEAAARQQAAELAQRAAGGAGGAGPVIPAAPAEGTDPTIGFEGVEQFRATATALGFEGNQAERFVLTQVRKVAEARYDFTRQTACDTRIQQLDAQERAAAGA